MKITKLEGISYLAILDNITLYGSTVNAIPADPEYIGQVIASVEYPLPDVEVVILPFIIDRIDDEHFSRLGPVDGVAAYAARKIYLTAFHRFDWNTEAHRQMGWAKTCLHEIGHMVHHSYLPYPAYGEPQGLWQTFAQVAHPMANNSYETSLAEHFAEWWRFLVSPLSQGVPHRHGLPYRTGIKEWLYSLAGAQGFAIGHKVQYFHGECVQRDVAPIILDGRTFVPLRYIAEMFGYEVGWSGPETVIIWPKVGGG